MDRNQETMRVDVPVNALGIEDTITSCKSRMIDHSHIQDVYSHVKQDYGGVKVYNSLLYMVDEMVRLNQETIDNVYLKIVKDELDTDVEITRSYRRFM
jgi:hypothetical protein